VLTVVTLVKDRNEMLDTFLRAFTSQTDRRFEIVVVDAGGCEDPEDIIGRFPQLPVATHRLSGGERDVSTVSIAYSAARNAGARAGVGEHLVFCDADTIASTGFVAEVHRALDERAALCTVEVVYLPPLPSSTLAALPAEWLATVGRPHPARERPPKAGVRFGARHELVWGLCMAMRRDTFERSGGFDTSYDGYAGEDTDLARTLASMGIPAGLVGGAFVLHRHHDSFEPPLQQLRATTDNARRFHEKWGDWPMGGWLAGFRDLGLVEWDDDRLRVIREPTDDEVEAARCRTALPFRRQAIHVCRD
jgi:GT2 family glycosyltransferase